MELDAMRLSCYILCPGFKMKKLKPNGKKYVLQQRKKHDKLDLVASAAEKKRMFFEN
jgi:hypothetical protein